MDLKLKSHSLGLLARVADAPRADAVDACVVHGQEDGLESRGFDARQLVLQTGLVGPDVLLVEHDLVGADAGIGNLLDGLGGGDAGHVEHPRVARRLHEGQLGRGGVGEAGVGGRCDEEWKREVVPEDGGAKVPR